MFGFDLANLTIQTLVGGLLATVTRPAVGLVPSVRDLQIDPPSPAPAVAG